MQHEGQREDLIRTATALVQRVELAIDGFPDLLLLYLSVDRPPGRREWLQASAL